MDIEVGYAEDEDYDYPAEEEDVESEEDDETFESRLYLDDTTCRVHMKGSRISCMSVQESGPRQGL